MSACVRVSGEMWASELVAGRGRSCGPRFGSGAASVRALTPCHTPSHPLTPCCALQVVVVDDIEADAAANEQLRFMLPMSFGELLFVCLNTIWVPSLFLTLTR